MVTFYRKSDGKKIKYEEFYDLVNSGQKLSDVITMLIGGIEINPDCYIGDNGSGYDIYDLGGGYTIKVERNIRLTDLEDTDPEEWEENPKRLRFGFDE